MVIEKGRAANGTVRAVSGINVLVGAWLTAAPWALGHTEVVAALWNDVVVGLAILMLAGIRLAIPKRSTGASLANALLGVWLIAAPFALGYGVLTASAVVGAVALWNDIIVGATVLALAAVSAASSAKPA